jgi:hypothetical protein
VHSPGVAGAGPEGVDGLRAVDQLRGVDALADQILLVENGQRRLMVDGLEGAAVVQVQPVAAHRFGDLVPAELGGGCA